MRRGTRVRRGIMGAEPGQFHRVLPPWLEAGGTSVVAIVLAAVSFHGVGVDLAWAHPGLAGAAMAVAVAPWVLNLFIEVRAYAWTVSTMVALAVFQVGGAAWGWPVPEDAGMEQASFMLSCWLAVDTAVSRRPLSARVTFVGLAATMVAHGMVVGFDTTPLWLAGLLFAFLGGLVLRTLALTVVRLRDAEGRLAAEAVAAEQRRIAREVHDVVAHALAVTALHLSAARMAAARGDLTGTQEALADAERLNRASLGDLRQTVRLLRPGVEVGPRVADPGGDGRTQRAAPEPSLPGIDQLAEVVASARAAGLAVTLDLAGAADAVDDLVGLTVLRVVQEALTNAVRHQEDPSGHVVVRLGSDEVEVVVRSTGRSRPPGDPGIGLVGMRERVESLGGDLRAGPVAGGWEVRAAVPSRATVPDPVGR